MSPVFLLFPDQEAQFRQGFKIPLKCQIGKTFTVPDYFGWKLRISSLMKIRNPPPLEVVMY